MCSYYLSFILKKSYLLQNVLVLLLDESQEITFRKLHFQASNVIYSYFYLFRILGIFQPKEHY